ncbi:MAG TPA: amidohydrolase family protein [Falsiroseomonas sp.]|jgi:5-methylthioadenosine/S-adenosylhomocysteine deaminase|nr:amidohydrolase family protein [Falsiroseomonas sp.]
MDLLITDTVVVTQDDQRTILDRGAVAIRSDRIVAVGPSAELEAAHPDLPRLAGRGKAVLPGFINSHTHTILTVLRATVEDWAGNAVYGYMSPVSYTMTPEERQVMAVLGVLEGIRSGCTMFVDPFRHVPDYAAAMAGTGARLLLSENCADVNTLKIRHGDWSPDPAFGEAFLDRTIAGIERFHGTHDGRLQIQIAAHATDNCTPAYLERLTQLARKHGMPRTVHLAQSMEEVRVVRERHGCTPAEYLARNGWADPDVIAAHWTFCTAGDVELLAKGGVHWAHCPPNASRRGPHPALAKTIRKAGVNIVFGSDNMTEDMFHALKIGLIVHRGAEGTQGVDPSPEQVFDSVNRNGAKAIGRLADLGTIEAGKKADLTLVNLNTPVMRPVTNLVGNLVHYGHPGIVESVMVDGQWVMRDGRILTVDELALLAEAQKVTRRVWERMLAANPDLPPPRTLRWLDV